MTLVRILLGTVLLLLLNTHDGLTSDYTTLRLELVSCQPDGIINAWRARWNPKKFWVEQVVVLEMAAERSSLADSLRECQSESAQADRVNCTLYFKNRHAAWMKCLAHARALCRLNGGC